MDPYGRRWTDQMIQIFSVHTVSPALVSDIFAPIDIGYRSGS